MASEVCTKLAAAKEAAEALGNSTLVAMIDSAMYEAGCGGGAQTNDDSGPRGPVPPPPPPPPGPPSDGGSGS